MDKAEPSGVWKCLCEPFVSHMEVDFQQFIFIIQVWNNDCIVVSTAVGPLNQSIKFQFTTYIINFICILKTGEVDVPEGALIFPDDNFRLSRMWGEGVTSMSSSLSSRE